MKMIILATALILPAAPAMAQTMLLASVADVPVLEGSTMSEDCGGMQDVLRGSDSAAPIECVTARMSAINDLQWAYVRAAQTRGWTFEGGEASSVRLTRAKADGSCERLFFTSFWDYRAHPEPRPREPGYIAVGIQPARRCPSEASS